MNRINPKSLLHSKWTKIDVTDKELHFVVTTVRFDEHQNVTECIIEAVINNNEYQIEWRELKNDTVWQQGWK